VRSGMAVAIAAAGLLGCSAADLPAQAARLAAGAAAAPATAAEFTGGAPGRPDLGVGAPLEQTVAELRTVKTSAFELALFRLEMLEAPKLKALLVEHHVLRPHPQAMGAYTYSETGEVRVHLDDDWQQELAAGRPFIAVRVDFGTFEQAQSPPALDDLRRRAAEAVAYVRTGLTGSNGCEPWEITANGMSQGQCTYHLIEQRFFPQTKSGYAHPMDPARMHAVANLARAFRVEAVAGVGRGAAQAKWLTCAGPITADETRCDLRGAPAN